MYKMKGKAPLVASTLAAALAISALAAVHEAKAAETATPGAPMVGTGMMGQGMLEMPKMDPARGRKLFASKGCVVCHSVNGVGGEDAPPVDASTMEPRMNPFEFTAKMWRGAEAMIELQREELGEQIEFTGDELADIIAFTHHPAEQQKFSEADIPPRVKSLMHHMEEEEHHETADSHGTDERGK